MSKKNSFTERYNERLTQKMMCLNETLGMLNLKRFNCIDFVTISEQFSRVTPLCIVYPESLPLNVVLIGV